ncbi:MAG: SH3 domain-containing protein [Burkholderiaceae bacterium]|nr:SH3 domain-containing protein [Burkholderiaceae bacterium]
MTLSRFAAVLLGLAALLLPAHAQQATNADTQASVSERLTVVDPFLEMRTGPGRGYPVFFVVARGQAVIVELRHTDWYKVRAEGGQLGWVHRHQLETTLTAAGSAKTFRDIALDDYLSRRVQLGAAVGRFKSEPMLKLYGSYKLSDTLSVEADIGQVQGIFSGSNFWHVALHSEPWSDRRLSPFFGVGVGQFKNFPNQSLVGATVTDAKLAHAIVGARYYLSERFVLRADWAIYTAFVSDQRSTEYRAITAGVSFFF